MFQVVSSERETVVWCVEPKTTTEDGGEEVIEVTRVRDLEAVRDVAWVTADCLNTWDCMGVWQVLYKCTECVHRTSTQ